MGFLDLFRRAHIEQGDPDAHRIFFNTLQPSGVRVNHDIALTYDAFWAAVRVISETVSQLPWHIFRRTNDAARTIMFVDMGSASTQVVLSHGTRLVFARNLPMGGRQLDQAVADGMDVSLSQAHSIRWDLLKGHNEGPAEDELHRLLDAPLNSMADELTQCLRYYESAFRNQSVERAIFVGGQAYDKRLCQSLAQRLNLPAQVGDPLVRVKLAEGAVMPTSMDSRQPQPNWAVAIGLSLGSLRAA